MEFDYVIAGGGSAGCVLAARLSEDPTATVCLIEAGGEGRGLLIRAPALVAAMVPGRPPLNNWALHTVPQPGLGGRRGFQPRGRALGGSSAINAMLYVRGHPSDYDDWADAGADGWDWQSVPAVVPASRREHARGRPTCTAPTARCKSPTSAFPVRSRALSCMRRGPARSRRTTISTVPRQEGAGLYQVTQFHDGPTQGRTLLGCRRLSAPGDGAGPT